MAFPVVESVTEYQQASQQTSHNVTMPATVTADDLLLMLFCCDQDVASGLSLTTPSGWTQIVIQSTTGAYVVAIYAKKAVGNEGGTTVNVAITGSPNSQVAVAQTYRITGWGGTIADDIDISAIASSGFSTTVDTSAVTAGWGSADNLFIVMVGAADDDAVHTSTPANYGNHISTVSGAGGDTNPGCECISLRRNLAAASDNPGSWTLTQGEAWAGWTLVVEPGSAGGGSAPIAPTFPRLATFSSKRYV